MANKECCIQLKMSDDIIRHTPERGYNSTFSLVDVHESSREKKKSPNNDEK